MKKIIFAFLFITIIVSCVNKSKNQNKGFVIKGTASAYDSSYVYLQKVVDGELSSIDSSFCTEGKFGFKGKTSFPEMYYLNFSKKRYIAPVFIENSDINVAIKFDGLQNITISGSKTNDLLKQFHEEMLPFDNKIKDLRRQLNDATKERNTLVVNQIDSTLRNLEKDKVGFIINYIGSHNESAISPYIVSRELSFCLEADKLDSVVNLLDSSLHHSPYVNRLEDKIGILKQVSVGKKAPDFRLNDPTGKPISLSSFNSQYLLIDFWASWCGDCRRENPNLVDLYANYKDKGLEILGVSFDKTKKEWLAGIKNDQLTWPQVSDLKGWKSEAGKLYGVSSIPHLVLLNKEGVIIAKNLKDEELRKKIAELLD